MFSGFFLALKRAQEREAAAFDAARAEMSGKTAPELASAAGEWEALSGPQRIRAELTPGNEQRVRAAVAKIELARNTPLPHEHR